MPEEHEKLNPQIVDVEIGIRSLRKIKIYPLSMADQLKLTKLVSDAVAGQMSTAGDIEIVPFVLQMIKDNIGQVLTMTTDEDAELLSEISNMQMIEIADVLFDVNYGAVSKNFKSLSEKLMGLFQSERPSPPSANDTDTVLETSTEKPSETEG